MAGITPTALNTSQDLISQGVFGTTLQTSKAVPIVGTIIGVGLSIYAIFKAAHAQKVKVEAQTMSAAVPQWRSLLQSTVSAYNSGEIDANAAVGYIEQAKGIYYDQVKNIERGKPSPPGFPGYSGPHGRFAPIDPCNAACSVAYFFVEPEAKLVEDAFRSGKATSIDLLPIVILNTGGQGGSPPMQLVVQPPVLESVIPAAIYSQLPDVVKSNPLIFAALALVAGVVIFKR
jgi:hypothetical protein